MAEDQSAKQHSPKVVEVKQVNNEYVAYRIQCCDDEHENTWHTVSIHHPDHDGYLEGVKSEIAARHEKVEKWREKHGL